MGKRSTTKGYWRQYGAQIPSAAGNRPSIGVVPNVLRIAGLDATVDAGTGTGKYLPKGAVPLSVAVKGNGTGGTTPLMDVGLEESTPDDDGLVDGVAVDADSNTPVGATEAGALLGTELTETSEVTYGDDGSGTNATGGTVDILITYTFADDGKAND